MTNINTNAQDFEEPLFSRSGVSIMTVSQEVADLARKNHAAILRSMGEVGQVNAANTLEVHEATISRMKAPGGEFERMALVLAAVGIALPTNKQVVVDRDVYEASKLLAHANLDADQKKKTGISDN